MRSKHGQFPQYHTSADDPDFVDAAALGDSLATVLSAFEVLERDGRYRNLNPFCEPQLGRRGLYRAMGGSQQVAQLQMAMLWVLNQSDGRASLLDIAQRAGQPFDLVREAADLLLAHELLAPVEETAA